MRAGLAISAICAAIGGLCLGERTRRLQRWASPRRPPRLRARHPARHRPSLQAARPARRRRPRRLRLRPRLRGRFHRQRKPIAPAAAPAPSPRWPDYSSMERTSRSAHRSRTCAPSSPATRPSSSPPPSTAASPSSPCKSSSSSSKRNPSLARRWASGGVNHFKALQAERVEQIAALFRLPRRQRP